MAVHKLAAVVTQSMLDDQKTIVHWSAQDSTGAATSFPTGAVISNAITPPDPSATLDTTTDPTGMNVGVIGVKKSAGGTGGTPHVVGTFTNADGSVATGEVDFTITIDPLELDVASLGATVDPPVAQ